MTIAVHPLTPARWPDLEALFDAAGFEEVARRKPQRPIVRLGLRRNQAPEPGKPRANPRRIGELIDRSNRRTLI